MQNNNIFQKFDNMISETSYLDVLWAGFSNNKGHAQRVRDEYYRERDAAKDKEKAPKKPKAQETSTTNTNNATSKFMKWHTAFMKWHTATPKSNPALAGPFTLTNQERNAHKKKPDESRPKPKAQFIKPLSQRGRTKTIIPGSKPQDPAKKEPTPVLPVVVAKKKENKPLPFSTWASMNVKKKESKPLPPFFSK